MSKNYETPEVEIIELCGNDLIATSNTDPSGGDGVWYMDF